ncbi:hypothetical protein BB561_002184 [Smittium simulii]|uniref:AMP-dependent synthetase/ligase domain-containing protein n=1 Tax=Smittium simulii TaxID=133385 RepID=A0A2T9YRP5_9FUNG|nr:hypothetical protein BB561_002184 [Smittium simulii]
MDYFTPNFKSYVVPNSEKSGRTPVLRNKKFIEDSLITEFSQVKTIYDIFWRGKPYNPETSSFLSYKFYTYKESAEIVTNFASGLIHLTLKLSKTEAEKNSVLQRQWPVALYSINRPEWNLTDRACSTQSLISVALYDTLGHDSMTYILNHCKAPVIVCTVDKISRILLNIQKLPNVKIIISIDSLSEPSGPRSGPPNLNIRAIDILKQWAEHYNVTLVDFDQVKEYGKQHKIDHHPPKPSDIYTMLYTSGTTGNPKGVMSTHENYAHAARYSSLGKLDKNNTPVILSYLPLAHCYGRNVENYNTLLFGSIGYYSGDISRILEDSRDLQPTSFPGIPRLLNRFYDVLRAQTIDAPGLTGVLYRAAIKEKLEILEKTGNPRHEFWDATLFERTRGFISKRLTVAGSGSASIEPQVLNFLRVVFCIDLVEGFGMTETSAIGSKQEPGDGTSGNIGVPLAGVEICLRDIPEMSYFTSDLPCPRGELLIRSKSVFSGYYNEPEKTAEAFLEDRWFASGDVARINLDGTISIIDRKKSIFKLAQGEYVAPERLENTLQKFPLVSQSFIYGKNTMSYPVGIIVPDEAVFMPWAAKLVKQNKSFKDMTKDPIIVAAFLEEIAKYCKESKMNGFEIIKKLYLEYIPFDATTNKLLTPTMKLKRFDASKYYSNTLDNLYS